MSIMDLSTLPIEMRARIAKYLNHLELAKLRKSSVLFQKAIDRYGICTRIPVRQCFFDFISLRIRFSLPADISIFHKLNPIFTSNKGHMDELIIANCRKTTLQALQTHPGAFKQCRMIHFQHAEFGSSVDELPNFLNAFPKVVELSNKHANKNEYILNYEVLSSKKWMSISVSKYDSFPCPTLNDRVLDIIAANRTVLDVEQATTSFTVKGVAKALLALSSGGRSIGSSAWGIIDARGINIEEAVELLRNIPNVKIEFHRNSREVKVKFERDPSMCVQFKIA